VKILSYSAPKILLVRLPETLKSLLRACVGQSCPWVGSTHGLGRVGSTIAKVLKIRNDYVNAFKTRLDKIWFHQTVKFDFTADLTGTGNR